MSVCCVFIVSGNVHKHKIAAAASSDHMVAVEMHLQRSKP